jgi:hypothetical protein
MMTERQIVDVWHKTGDGREAVTRYNAALVEFSAGGVAIFDRGLVAAFAPGTWSRVERVDPESETEPAGVRVDGVKP